MFWISGEAKYRDRESFYLMALMKQTPGGKGSLELLAKHIPSDGQPPPPPATRIYVLPVTQQAEN